MRKANEDGIAIIVALAVVVAAVMIAAALLATVTRSSGTAQSYKRNDILQLTLDSAKADLLYRISANAIPGIDSNASGGGYIYDIAATTWLSAAGFAASWQGANDADFYRTFHDGFNFAFSGAEDEHDARFYTAYRVFVVPQSMAVNLDYFRKYRDENGKERYPFPGLFDGDEAIARNVAAIFTSMHKDDDSQRLDRYFDFSGNTLSDGRVVSSPTRAIANILLRAQKEFPTSMENRRTTINDLLLNYRSHNGEKFSTEQWERFIDSLAAASVPEKLTSYDNARLLVNYDSYVSNPSNLYFENVYPYESLAAARASFDKYKAYSPATNQIKSRNQFSSLTEIGVAAHILNAASGVATPEPAIITASLPYTLSLFNGGIPDDPAFVSKGKNHDGKEIIIPSQIPLNKDTPDEIIEAAVGWQLFESPTAQERIDDGSQSPDSIFRVDFTVNKSAEDKKLDQDLTYVFNHRRLVNNFGANTDGLTADVLRAPPAVPSSAVTGSTLQSSGVITAPAAYHKDFLAYPLRYRYRIEDDCTITYYGTEEEPVGWEDTRALDLLPFAEITTAGSKFLTADGYITNQASPFRVGDDLSGLGLFIDKRTGTFTGVGTFVTPEIHPYSIAVADANNRQKWGQLGSYSNSLRVHNELAAIVKIICEHKGDDDAVAVIIREIYSDPQIGYVEGAETQRRMLAPTNADPGSRGANIIWHQKRDSKVATAADFSPIMGNASYAPTFKAKNDPIGSLNSRRYTNYDSQITTALLSRFGGGATGDYFNNSYQWLPATGANKKAPIKPNSTQLEETVSLESTASGNLVYCDEHPETTFFARSNNARAISAPPYRRSTGRWYIRGAVPTVGQEPVPGGVDSTYPNQDALNSAYNNLIAGAKAKDNAGYLISVSNLQPMDTPATSQIDPKHDPSMVGTSYRSDSAVWRFFYNYTNPAGALSKQEDTTKEQIKMTSLWHWQWGKWERSGTGFVWKDAVGESYPMYIEVNPQAVKNAAIERVVINLFGKSVIDKDGNEVVKKDYLDSDMNGDHKSEISDADGKSPIFSNSPASYYRVIVAAAVLRPNSVMTRRFLQFVCKRDHNGKVTILDSHYLDDE